MRIVFFGSPGFAVPSLEALVEAGHEVTLAVSQPAKPVGRKALLTDPPVAARAKELGIPCFQPQKLRTEEALGRIGQEKPDFLVVAAYGKILPQALLDLPSIAPVNVHGSILPRWRGASPIQASLLAGDGETGISIMRMVAEMDAGPVYATARVTVLESDETPSLTDRLSRLGAELLVSSFPAIAEGTLVAVPQEDEHVTFCPKIERDDGQVDWSRPAIELERKSRAFTPWPGLFCHRGKERVKLVGVKVVPGDSRPYAPGTVVAADASIVIAAGEGLVSVSRLQRDGRKELPSSDFVRGERVVAGEVWQ